MGKTEQVRVNRTRGEQRKRCLRRAHVIQACACSNRDAASALWEPSSAVHPNLNAVAYTEHKMDRNMTTISEYKILLLAYGKEFEAFGRG